MTNTRTSSDGQTIVLSSGHTQEFFAAYRSKDVSGKPLEPSVGTYNPQARTPLELAKSRREQTRSLTSPEVKSVNEQNDKNEKRTQSQMRTPCSNQRLGKRVTP
jgi:hypothetical protein